VENNGLSKNAGNRLEAAFITAGQNKNDEVRAMAGTSPKIDITARHKTDPVPFFHGKSHIGRYELMFSLDMGGMAAVYAGRLAGPAGFEKLVALKIIYPHLAAEEAFINMFFDEARIVARIQHPNVAEIYEVGQDEGVYFMAMELIEGQSLHHLAWRIFEQGIHVPTELYADIVARICRGIHDAHELRDADGKPLNLVHRDISPRNVLVSYKGEVKLIDFGVAYAEERLTHTQNGKAKGKVGYMPPEYIRDGIFDRRSDIFALGVVLYNLLTSVHPHPGDTEGEKRESILNGRVVPPSQLCPDLDPQLEVIVLRAIDKDPNERYETAQEMAEALEGYVRGSRTAVGGAPVAELMAKLFPEEADDFQKKLRQFRKRNPKAWDTPSAGTPTGPTHTGAHPDDASEQITGVIQGDPLALFTDSELVFGERNTLLERVEENPRASHGRKKPWLAMTVATTSVLLGLLALLLSRNQVPQAPLPATSPEKEVPWMDLQLPEPKPEEAATPPMEAASAPAGIEAAPAPAAIETVRIRFELEDAEVEIFLDGVALAEGTREVVLRRDGITRTLEFKRPGFLPRRFTFEATVDQFLEVALQRAPSRQKSAKTDSSKEERPLLTNPFD
jgi:serine/threonine-protein kinase